MLVSFGLYKRWGRGCWRYITQIPAHSHSPDNGQSFVTNGGGLPGGNTGSYFGGQAIRTFTTNQGGSLAHPNVGPTLVVPFIIKT